MWKFWNLFRKTTFFTAPKIIFILLLDNNDNNEKFLDRSYSYWRTNEPRWKIYGLDFKLITRSCAPFWRLSDSVHASGYWSSIPILINLSSMQVPRAQFSCYTYIMYRCTWVKYALFTYYTTFYGTETTRAHKPINAKIKVSIRGTFALIYR